MELRQVRTFRAVAEELSFSRAAAKLGYVQSSVSAQVGALERELGVPLFDRLGRRIKLTDAGKVMLSHSRKLLVLAEETKGAVVDAGAGSGPDGERPRDPNHLSSAKIARALSREAPKGKAVRAPERHRPTPQIGA
jgi:DNA-binding transcriptional LysR family regulator